MESLDFIVKIIFILQVFRNMDCKAREVIIPFDGKLYNFDISLLQRKVFHYVPLWTIEVDPSGHHAYTYEGIAKINGIIYKDPTKKAILFKKSNCYENCWEGVFGFGTKRNVISNRTKLQAKLFRTLKKEKETIYTSHPLSASSKRKSKLNSGEQIAKKPGSTTNKFYPKLLVVIDHALYKKLGSNLKYALEYLGIFWSAVDLQYKNVSTTDIELRITGLIIAKDDTALDYVTKNSADGKTANINGILHGSSAIIGHIDKTNLISYDAVVTMTGLEGYVEHPFGNIKQKIESSGATYNGSICMDEYNFSVFTDDGAYLGIHNAIHEIGHLLGLDHDGTSGNAFRCFPKDRHSLSIMWSRFEIRDDEYWSECSLRALKIFTDSDDESWCLKHKTHFHNNKS